MRKLGRVGDQRKALLRNQASYLLMYGKIETTVARAKEVQAYAEKLITLAMNTYEDIVKVPVTKTDDKGKEIKLDKINDGPKKLAARRKLMSKLYEIPQDKLPDESFGDYKKRTKNNQHPLVEKVFNELAPKYAKRAEEKGTRGGYTRTTRVGFRRGDAAEMMLLELI